MSRTLLYFPILPPNWINVSLRHPQGRISESINAIHYEIWTFKSSCLVCCNCYCKSPPLQLCFAHRSISPPNLVSFLFCFLLFNQCPSKALFPLFQLCSVCFCFFVTSFTIFIIIIMVSRFDCYLVGGLKQSDMQDFRYHTLWSVWESRGFTFGREILRRAMLKTTINHLLSLRKANASLHAKLILSPLLVNSTGKNLLAKQIII